MKCDYEWTAGAPGCARYRKCDCCNACKYEVGGACTEPECNTEITDLRAALEAAETEIKRHRKHEENVTKAMIEHRGKAFTSHVTDAVITLIWEIRELQKQHAVGCADGEILSVQLLRAESKLRDIENWATVSSAKGLNVWAVPEIRAILDKKE